MAATAASSRRRRLRPPRWCQTRPDSAATATAAASAAAPERPIARAAMRAFAASEIATEPAWGPSSRLQRGGEERRGGEGERLRRYRPPPAEGERRRRGSRRLPVPSRLLSEPRPWEGERLRRPRPPSAEGERLRRGSRQPSVPSRLPPEPRPSCRRAPWPPARPLSEPRPREAPAAGRGSDSARGPQHVKCAARDRAKKAARMGGTRASPRRRLPGPIAREPRSSASATTRSA